MSRGQSTPAPGAPTIGATPVPASRATAGGLPGTPKAPAQAPADSKVQALVAEFIEDKKRELSATAPTPSVRNGRHGVIAVLALVCIAAWVAPYPDPASTARANPRLEQASAQATLYLAAKSIEHFVASRGRLPRSLAEAGVEREEITFSLEANGTYTLRTMLGSREVSYNSSTPLKSFVGRSEEIIAQSGH